MCAIVQLYEKIKQSLLKMVFCKTTITQSYTSVCPFNNWTGQWAAYKKMP